MAYLYMENEIKSLKAQLAETEESNLKLFDACQLSEKIINERDLLAKQNYVLREALGKALEIFIDYRLCQITEDNTAWQKKYGDISGEEAIHALSTPPIEGLVVCKDEPIYLMRGFYGFHMWTTTNKHTYDSIDNQGDKRIVYRKD